MGDLVQSRHCCKDLCNRDSSHLLDSELYQSEVPECEQNNPFGSAEVLLRKKMAVENANKT